MEKKNRVRYLKRKVRELSHQVWMKGILSNRLKPCEIVSNALVRCKCISKVGSRPEYLSQGKARQSKVIETPYSSRYLGIIDDQALVPAWSKLEEFT